MKAQRLARAGAVLASAVLLVALALPTGTAAVARSTATVSMTVDSITPWAPTASYQPSPLTVQLTLTSNADLHGVRVTAERGEPIGNQSQLDNALANPGPPATAGLPIPAHPAVSVDLVAGQPTTVTFQTSTSVQVGLGICFCHPAAIYPLFFSAHQTVDGVDQRLGVVGTYLPIFEHKPSRLHVSWIWPLLDRPHRLDGETTFSDDGLADELGPDGRLDRALQVVEQVGGSVPLTLVVDPDLLDEIWVMANEPYLVGTGKSATPGTGKAVAAEWLARLKNVLTADPNVQVELTPYADPDIAAVAAHGLTWEEAIPATMTAHVTAALAGRPLDSTLAWPATGAVGPQLLGVLANDGVNTVVLNASAVTPRVTKGEVPPGLARLHAAGTDIAAALTTPAIERYAARAIAPAASGSSALPDLLAELAVRPAQEVNSASTAVETFAAITPPRYVDPNVQAAVDAIRTTSSSDFTQPIALADAVRGDLLPTGRSGLVSIPPNSVPTNPALEAASDANTDRGAIASLLDQARDPTARQFVQNLQLAIQRAESSAWGQSQYAQRGATMASQLSTTIDDITTGVHIVAPSGGSYTLASNNAPLPITVDNELTYPVRIIIKIVVPNQVAGFSSTPTRVLSVDSKQKKTINIPTSTQRAGRFRIIAELETPNGTTLGTQALVVRSTALGFVGLLITIVAGVVLALALLVRFARRLRNRRSRPLLPPRIADDLPEPVRD